MGSDKIGERFSEFTVNKIKNIKYYLAALVAFASFIVYLPALQNQFVEWDDNLYVLDNFHIRSFDLSFFKWSFFDFYAANWHPLTWISHALDYSLWGLNPLGHHLTNIILHAINAFIVVLLIISLLEAGKRRAGGEGLLAFDHEIMIAAGVTGLLFGLHPLHVESVAWVAERKDLLCALFFLLSIIMYTRRARGRASTPRPMLHAAFTDKYYLASLGFFVLALLSKPMAVTLPLVLLLLDWHPLGRITSRKTFRFMLFEKIPFLAFSLVSSILTILAQRAGNALQPVDFAPLPTRVLVSASSLIRYLVKMALPFDLSPYYPYPKDASVLSWEYALPLLLLIGIMIAIVALHKKARFLSGVWAYYAVTLIPVLGIIQVGSQSMADRYTYLPSLGPFLAMGLGFAWIIVFLSRRRGMIGKIAGPALAVLVFVPLSYLTVGQIAVWRSGIDLWNRAVEKGAADVAFVRVNRGVAFKKKGLLDQAIPEFEQAIALDPSLYKAYINLETCYEEMGMFDRAKENVDRAIALNPGSYEAYRNRGILFEKAGRMEDAINDFTAAIVLNPAYFEAYNNRGLVFGKLGRYDQAIADYDQALKINPAHLAAYTNRGVAYTLIGQYDRALEDFNYIVRVKGSDPAAYYNRAALYRRAGNMDAARMDFRRACELGNSRACEALQ